MKQVEPSRTIVVSNVFAGVDFAIASTIAWKATCRPARLRASGTCMRADARRSTIRFREFTSRIGWNTACNVARPMRTTLGQLVSDLVDSYERMYHDPELAAVATSVTLEEMFETNVARRNRQDDTVRLKKMR